MRHDARLADAVDKVTRYTRDDLADCAVLRLRDHQRRWLKTENDLQFQYFETQKALAELFQGFPPITTRCRCIWKMLDEKGGEIMDEQGELLLQAAAKEAFDIITPILDGWDGTSDLMAMITEAIQGMGSFSAVASYFAPGQTVALVLHVAIRALPQLVNLVKPLQVAVNPA